MTNTQDLRALLAFHVEAGVDVAVGEQPIDWLNAPDVVLPRPAEPLAPQRGAMPPPTPRSPAPPALEPRVPSPPAPVALSDAAMSAREIAAA